ncbi:hypothetical protein [Frigoribacterium sp. PvP032]|uniref:hypothetical protein n=1 Tax=Frigoribacterium sp. PvP032 TaxID=2806589 RepID=UPI001AE5045F|nr:hypothetical protein [Frigoribacterium sp. PvP032]MBP1191599.1 hypothetical protein [Frigoribacterium sp. PvP032]
MSSPTTLCYSDPIPTVLTHFRRELAETLAGGGADASRAHWSRPVEGLPGPGGALRMGLNCLYNTTRARLTRGPVLQLWPSLGLLEARGWASRRHPRWVLFHDPTPLRRQHGFSERSRRWARRAPAASRPTLVVLSRAALDVVRRELPAHPAVLTMHPILDEQRLTPKTSRPSVVVAGQYKPARDLELLAQLGPRLRDAGWTTTIVGRGWPPVPGWDVDDRFVPEDELDDLLGAAWALLLPYREYFQSGVAVRALENGTPTVGESTSFLDDLQPAHKRLRVPVGACAEAWLEALSHVTDDPSAAQEAFVDYRERARKSWGAVFGDPT